MDLALHMGAKLSGEWSAASAAGMLSEPVIQYLSGRLDSLEPLARARVLISPLFLRRTELAELAGPLDVLAQAGATDRCACWARRLVPLISIPSGSVRGRGAACLPAGPLSARPLTCLHPPRPRPAAAATSGSG